MNAIALVVLLAVAAISIWAFRRRPGRLGGDDFVHVWSFSPWGKQFMVDFFGLEIVLALWMVSHAVVNDSLALAIGCIALMPIFGAMPAAAYWIVSGGA